MLNLPIILASQSPARLELLQQIGVYPDRILPANIDESELKHELPDKLAIRLALAKAKIITEQIEQGVVIAADTVVEAGKRILPKALSPDDVKYCMQHLSGRRHRVYSAVCIIKKEQNDLQIRQKLVQTIIKFKRLTDEEITFYCTLSEGINKAGGYSLRGLAESFVQFISGSYSNVIGLPLNHTTNMLNSLIKLDKYRNMKE